MSVPGPTPLTYSTVLVDPNPCTTEQQAKNWQRASQIPMILQNQITGPGGATTTLQNLTSINNYTNNGGNPTDGTSGGGTNTDQVLMNINNVIQWVNPQQVFDALLPHIGGWVLNDPQVIWHAATSSTIEWKSLTALSPYTDWRYNDSSSHKFQKKTTPTLVITTGSETSLSDTSGGQPVVLGDGGSFNSTVIDVDYNSRTSNKATQRKVSSVYVLEQGSASNSDVFDTAAC